jgi:sulfoxide reductase heme-binding subunit YedZ
MKSDPTFWILARASGMTAYLLLSASILAGNLVKTSPFGNRIKPATATDVHRTLALFGLAALVLHGVSLLADKSVKMPVLGLLVPGLSPYRPLAVGIGVLAAELMVLVYASFSFRKRIGTKNWRRLHWASYAVFLGAAGHGITAGTDASARWAQLIYLATLGAVAGAAGWRALAPAAPKRPKREAAAA